MNVKIKSDGVSCLVGNDYDQVYAQLRKALGNGDEQLFTERTPGNQYLQWELPGEGWISLTEGDPLMAEEVKRELDRRKKLVSSRFSTNQLLAHAILTVPEDSYVYFKPDNNGNLLIRLTAWGYRYPERVNTGRITGIEAPKVEREHVRILALYDEKPMPGKIMFLNGYRRQTDEKGILEVGDLPLGYSFTISADGEERSVNVVRGEGDIIMDFTRYTTIEVRATKDGKPYSGAKVELNYANKKMPLILDGNGKGSISVPVSLGNSECQATIDEETKSLTVVPPITTFEFALETPVPEPAPQPEVTPGPAPVPVEDPPKPETIPEAKSEPQVTVPAPVPVEEPKKKEVKAAKEGGNAGYLWGILGLIVFIILTVATGIFCYGMLF